MATMSSSMNLLRPHTRHPMASMMIKRAMISTATGVNHAPVTISTNSEVVTESKNEKRVISCARIFSSMASKQSSPSGLSNFFAPLEFHMQQKNQINGITRVKGHTRMNGISKKNESNFVSRESKEKILNNDRKELNGKNADSKSSKPLMDLETLNSIASRKSTPLSLSNMFRYASTGQQRLPNAQFLHKELPIRIAQRAVDLLTLPHGLNKTEQVRTVANRYIHFLQGLLNFPCPSNDKEEQEFTKLLQNLIVDRSTIPNLIARGLSNLRDRRRESLDDRRLQELEEALYRFFTARVGLRFLTEHHILSNESPETASLRKQQTCVFDVCDFDDADEENYEDFLGCIQKNCDPAKEARRVAKQVERDCRNSYGITPKIEVVDCYTAKNKKKNFTYVPHHLRYMLAELMKNSCRATVKRYMNESVGDPTATTLPPVRVIVVKAAEDVTIKIADVGGGVPRSKMEKIWTFAYSDVEHDDQLHETAEFATNAFTGGTIRGFGLPLVRIYARYFGGELTLNSTEGHGVDAYLYLPVLGAACENLPTKVERSPGNLDSMADKETTRSAFPAAMEPETLETLSQKAL